MSFYRDHLTDVEKKIFDGAKQVFEALLDDFNSKDLLRKGTPTNQRERLSKMWRQSRLFGMAFNTTIKLFMDREKFVAFANKNRDDGFNEQIITDCLLNQYIGMFIYNVETVFRSSLLFFIKEEQGFRKRMELGRLINAVKDISPQLGDDLEKLIDRELRNALAHGAIWFEAGGKVFLADNSHLENPIELRLDEFMIRVKKQNIVAHAFIETLMEKVDQGYFLG